MKTGLARWFGLWGVGIALTLECSSDSTQKLPDDEVARTSSPLEVVQSAAVLGSRLNETDAIEAHPDGLWLASSAARGGSQPALPRAFSLSAPRRLSDPIRLSREGDDSSWLEIWTLGMLDNVVGSIEKSTVVYRDADHDLDVVLALAPSQLDELRVLRSAQAPTIARYALDVRAWAPDQNRDRRPRGCEF